MNIIIVCHNIPYPPDKGEKIRAFNIIKYLSKNNNIFLFSLSRDKVNPCWIKELEKICKEVYVHELNRFYSALKAIVKLVQKKPLSVGYYYSSQMRSEIKKTIKVAINIKFISTFSN